MNKMLIEYFYEKEKNWADRPYLHQPFGDTWETYSWAEVGDKARRLATWLKKQCSKEKAHISIVSRNCREWAISDIAIQMAGFISVPFYANLNGKQLAEVIDLGDVDLVLFGKVDGWEDMKKGIPEGLPVAKFPNYKGNPVIDIGTDWATIMEENEPIEGNFIPKPEDIWSIIFTSGTTGTPKGAFYTHKKVGIIADYPHYNYWLDVVEGKENRFFSFLPLNHIAERQLLVASISKGVEIFFTESLDKFAQNLRDARPTCFFAVPRIWTKLKQGILAKMPQKKLDRMLSIPFVNSIVKNKLKKALGLDKARVVITGAAPMSKHDVEWWIKTGFPLSDAYGQTENFAICSYSPVGKIKAGAVGIAHDDVELKIDPDNQELLVRTSLIMNGYYKDEEKTAETIRDGWLYTGDAAKVDEDGYLFITGRVKDTFKTEKGQFIVPAKVENLYGNNEDIEQLCLLGLGMPHPIMVIIPSESGGSKAKDELEESLQTTMKAVNQKLPNYTRVGTMVVSKDPFTVENGLLTPTLKVKRFNVNAKYRDVLRGYCEDSKKVIWE